MECNNCGNLNARAWRLAYDKKYGRQESCDGCGSVSANAAYVPDVFWNGPGYHPGLVDQQNKPIYLESRRHKAKVMKEQNSREAGDLNHGSRGTEGMYVPRRTIPNQNVLKLKKMFEEHQRSI